MPPFFGLLALALGTTLAQRTRVSFDADWRFQLGDSRTPLPCDPTSFTPLNATQCLGFSHVSSATTPEACFSSCCLSNACSVWTFAPGAGCWVGDGCTNFLPDKAWVGGTRNGPAPPPTCGPNDPCSPTFNDSSWRALSVPHDYAIEGVFDPSLDPNKGALPKNVSWYRKSFTLDAAAAGALVHLQFDGVFRAADVFFNGVYVSHHEEGYTSFIIWLHNTTAPLHTDGTTPNLVSLFVDGREPELWSYEGMGIYRHVWLEIAPPLSIVPWGFFTTSYINGTITSPGGPDAPQTTDGAIFTPTVDLANAGRSEAKGGVVFSLQDASGATVCSSAPISYTLAPGTGWVRLSTQFTCGSPTSPIQLWNTAPGGAYLYTAVASVMDGGGGVVDTVSVRHGVRSALFTPTQGFVLNGFKITLRGFSNHLGFGGCGGAVPDRVSEYILVMLKSMGGNSYRTAHNPISPEFLELADMYGVIVWEENRFVELGVLPLTPHSQKVSAAVPANPNSPRTLRTTPTAVPRLVADATDMVLRDRNHPSIVIWSLCNELGCTSDDPNGMDIAVQFKISMYNADNSRPITGNTVQRPYLSGRLVDEFAQAMDVQSFSHQFENVPAFHAIAPWKAVGLGESGSCECDRGEFKPRSNRTTGVSGFDGVVSCIVENLQNLAIPYSYGSYSWTLMDYMGETSLGWPDVSSHYGLFDIAGFRKDTWGLYYTWWVDALASPPCTYISLSPSDWTAPATVGGNITVYAFTCAPQAELFVNGASQGVVSVPQYGAAQWPGVRFQTGNITAVALGGGGEVVGTTSVSTTGVGVSLRAWVEGGYLPPRNASVISGGVPGDAAVLGVEVLDAGGRVVTAGPAFNVSFSVSGPATLYGVHNGSPFDHSSAKGQWRDTFHGKARAIVTSSGGMGLVTVTASAPGLTDGVVVLEAK